MGKPLIKKSCLKDEEGFVLVAALSCLVVLSMIGLAAMNTSNMEKQIAQNVNITEKTFYRADGSTEVGIEMIEFNLSCPLGFQVAGFDDTDPATTYQIGGTQVADTRLAYREDSAGLPMSTAMQALWAAAVTPAQQQAFIDTYVPSDEVRSIIIPDSMLVQNPYSNLAIFGQTTLGAGAAVQMAAGYEGKGKGAAGGGGIINYNVFAQNLGLSNSQSIIRLGWRHLIGMEGECRPY